MKGRGTQGSQHYDYGSGVQIHVGKGGSADSFDNQTRTMVNKSDSNGDGDGQTTPLLDSQNSTSKHSAKKQD